jgi:hypothetical protein
LESDFAGNFLLRVYHGLGSGASEIVRKIKYKNESNEGFGK